MKKIKVLVVGHFGYKNNQLDGQTVKTRTIFDSFKQNDCYHADYFDVSVKSFTQIIKLFKKLSHCDSLIFLPGKNQLTILSPLLVVWRLLFFKTVHYVVVGGWLPSLVEKSFYHRLLLMGFDSVSCELLSMAKSLKRYHKNSLVLTNYRPHTEDSSKNLFDGKTLKLVFFSRVIKDKGIFLAVELLRKIRSEGYNVLLDIYGPMGLVGNDFVAFENLLDESTRYLGALEPESIVNTLNGYHILLFPSYYEGEGFPGCIIDAKISGATVIATDWKYNNEIINSGVDGIVTGNNFVDDSCSHLELFFEKPEKLNELIAGAYRSRKEYFEDIAFYNWQQEVFNPLI